MRRVAVVHMHIEVLFLSCCGHNTGGQRASSYLQAARLKVEGKLFVGGIVAQRNAQCAQEFEKGALGWGCDHTIRCAVAGAKPVGFGELEQKFPVRHNRPLCQTMHHFACTEAQVGG